MKRILKLLAGLVLTTAASFSAAVPIGYFLNDAAGDPAAAITAAGHTPVALAGLTAGDLAGINVLWILNGDNDAAPADLVANAAAVAAFVAGGGVLSYHDRYVSEDGGASTNNAALPGAAGINFVRDFSDDANIEVLVINGVTNGPAGVIANDTLDGGDSSSHGYADNLPVGAVGVLSRTAADEVVDFYYGFGAGFVYYSTMPLDYYFGGIGNNPPQDNFTNIYAVNEAAFQAGLAQVVPEPATLALLGIALAGLGFSRRRIAA